MGESYQRSVEKSRENIMKKLFENIVGKENCLEKQEDIAPYVEDARNRFQSPKALVVRPKNVREVCEIVKIASEKGIAIIPQGGNTGLVAGGLPSHENQVIVSLRRMNEIIKVDEVSNTMIVEAGVELHEIHNAAKKINRLFPLSLGAQGSCCIGGNISTNAGGTSVLSYGNTRDLVLGLEVITADGEIVNMMSELRKDNAGIDLKNLFIGAEGTLGIITKAVVKLFPAHEQTTTMFIGAESLEESLTLLHKMQSKWDRRLIAFEAMNEKAMEMTLDGGAHPLGGTRKWCLLVEVNGGEKEMEMGDEIADGVVAQSMTQQEHLWRLRHNMPEAQKRFGACVKSDIALPLGRLSEFVKDADEAVLAIEPKARIINYGHLGDGNLHYNICQPQGVEAKEFLRKENEIIDAIYEQVDKYDGTFCAEHGIGQIKIAYLEKYMGGNNLNIMKKIKKELDPKNIMNPNKIFRL